MLQIHCIPAFTDNYFWLLQPDTSKSEAYILDPGDAEPVKKTLKDLGLVLAGIILTHHHHDHIDGAQALSDEFQLPIYGPQSARIPQVTNYLQEGDIHYIGSLALKIISLAGHTLDHIGYLYEPENQPPILFCGDTLFAGGCGRLFDGTAELLYHSLQKIARLPDETLIYCSHEYTLSNLAFAHYIEPENQDIINRIKIEQDKRDKGFATIPTTLLTEKRTNPFLRCHLEQVHRRVEAITMMKSTSTAEIFANLRRTKDQF